jgi:hypothetical protein
MSSVDSGSSQNCGVSRLVHGLSDAVEAGLQMPSMDRQQV